MTTPSARYQIQVRTDETSWAATPVVSNFPENVIARIPRFLFEGTRKENIRIWDLIKNQEHVPALNYVESVEHKLERESRQASLQPVPTFTAESTEVRNQLILANLNQLELDARASVETKTVSTLNEFNQLTKNEQGVLAFDIQRAYIAADEDESYKNDETVYDPNKFVKNLISMGWTYNKPTA